MLPSDRLELFTHTLHLDGVDTSLSGIRRAGSGVPLVFLHGFGSTKEDYADIVHRTDLTGRPVLAWDSPGFGASTVSDPSRVTIAFLVEVTRALLDDAGYERVHLVGHSMGGLTALRFATDDPERIAGFVDIEGNLAPEDCFLSCQIIDHPRASPQEFLDDFRARVAASRFSASALFAAALPAKVTPGVVEPIFTSMVELSDHAPLLEDFLALPFPRMLMYGEQNVGLHYLSRLASHGVELAEIPACGHFPMYSNPVCMWERIAAFVNRVDHRAVSGRYP